MTAHEQDRSYVIISPCRDEVEYMQQTLESVVAQSVLPKLWLIVDDGSSDGSAEILAEYAARYSFIQILTREDRGYRSVGPGVIDAFYSGYKQIDPDGYRYLCKLDLDLELPASYFQRLIERMEADSRLGTCSGKPYNRKGNNLVSERRGDEMSVGMTKFYRLSCFRQIGGFVREVMWDAIDCHQCRYLGWKAQSWDEPDLRFVHLRVMGSSQQGVITGRMRHGFGQYFMGTGIVYMAATAAFRAVEYPLVIGGLAMFWGYLRCYFSGAAKYPDGELRAFIRRYQWQSLVFGKSKTTAQLDQKQKQFWHLARTNLPMPIMNREDAV